MPISVIIVTLATRAHADVLMHRAREFASPIEVVLAVVEAMPNYIERDQHGWRVENPALADENFADKWNFDDGARRAEFVRWHGKLESDLEALLHQSARMPSEDKIRSVFGDDPVAAVVRALSSLKNRLLLPASDAAWVSEQFHNERASSWAQWCLSRRKAVDHRPGPGRTYVDVGTFDGWATGGVAGYVSGSSKHRLLTLHVAGATDPHDLAARHLWADGTLVRVSALFVRLPGQAVWTPPTWPKTFEALNAFIAESTGHQVSLARWLNTTGWADDLGPKKKKKKARRGQPNDAPPGQRPMLVVLVHGNVMFGYQLYGSSTPKLQPPAIEPIHITRVDADWALARDHDLEVLHVRRKKRVLLLGAGSLGSPLCRILARAGVGHLDIVDAQLLETENTSRHELGIGDAGHSKARRLAEQIMRDVPGITVRGSVARYRSGR